MSQINKVAFFVEGYTESRFLENLLTEILTKKHFAIEKREYGGKVKGVHKYVQIETAEVLESTRYYILIIDCRGDNAVASNIRDQRASLIKAGYSIIVGLLDLFPREVHNLDKFHRGLLFYMPQNPIPVKFVVSVKEIETWFIADTKHYSKVDPLLSLELIKDKLGIDLDTEDLNSIHHPAGLLNEIYSLAGLRYIKRRNTINRTVDALDYADLYLLHPDRLKSLGSLINIINDDVIR